MTMTYNRDMVSEMDPLFPGRHNYKHRHRVYGRHYRNKKKVLCWVGAIAIVLGTALVVALVSIYLAHQKEDAANQFNGTLLPTSIVLLQMSWPIQDQRPAPAPSPLNVTINEIAESIEEGIIEGLKRDEVERQLSQKGITIQPGSPPHYHQKFSTTQPEAERLVRQGYDMDCTAKILANKLNLTKDEVMPAFEDLPEVQLSTGCATVEVVSKSRCLPASPYRSADGWCNNLENPEWGSSFSSLRRMIPPDYADGVSDPRVSISGDELPSTRLVSGKVHSDEYRGDGNHSTLLMQWGQFIDHDITGTALTKGFNGSSITCCAEAVQSDPSLLHPECFPISIPVDDAFYSKFNQTCMEMVRSAPAPRCLLGRSGVGKVGYRNQLNQLTSFIDGSTIYGSTLKEQHALRNFTKGTLKSFQGEQNIELLPLTKDFNRTQANYTKGLLSWGKTALNVFESGDARVNEQIFLTSMHTIWMREHNRIAGELYKLNPHWTDEKLFQESRKIVIAELQHITYNEYLPEILGNEFVEGLNFTSDEGGYNDDYDPTINPTIANVFATAAFRFGHSQIQGVLKSTTINDISPTYSKLHNFFFNSFRLLFSGQISELVYGQSSMESRAVDRFFTDQVTNHLFESRDLPFGLDLVSINLQRGRDHGIPSYNVWRKHCGLPFATTFDDLLDFGWPKKMVDKVKLIYSSVDDIDLYTGGLGEPAINGGVVGHTFACIIADQFLRLKIGDRFWYETSESPQAFSKDQLKQIRLSNLARVFCDNVEEIMVIQMKVMKMTDSKNFPMSCYAPLIPSVDLSFWKEVLPKPNATSTL